ncbi:MAG: signal peptide peptidase SppA [Candidatus Binatia bacterium]|nr:MAG: signal peptide peptidase SppA [Candidatus Binatia bacterium]
MLWRLWLGIRIALHYVGEAFRWATGRKRPFALIRITLRGELRETSPAGFWSTRHPKTFTELVVGLRWAREDERVQAVFIHCDHALLGWAQVQELHRGLMALRKAGKRVYVALGQASAAEYVLASAADQIFLSPAGSLDMAGLSAEVWFFARTLAKLGIEPEIIQVGEYKSAAEVFTSTEMSPAHREAAEALLDHLFEEIAGTVAAGRQWEVQRAKELIEGGPYDPRTALEAKLVDELRDPIAAEWKVLETLGMPEGKAIDFHGYTHRRSLELRRLWWRYHGRHVAVVHVAGPLFDPPRAPARPSPLLRDLEGLREDPRVRAVVVRVVSPGGSAFVADRLWHALERIAERKPVVTSCGDVAASGGYYVAVVGQPLFAESASVTGSIGVLSGKFVFRGLYDRLGIDKDRIARGRHAGIASDATPLTAEERALLERHARAFYDRFVDIVAKARELEPERAEAASKGRVWSGQAALERGLVDWLGGFEQALDAAALLGGFDPEVPPPIAHYPRPRPFWQSFFERLRPSPPIPFPAEDSVIGSGVWAWLPVQYRFR